MASIHSSGHRSRCFLNPTPRGLRGEPGGHRGVPPGPLSGAHGAGDATHGVPPWRCVALRAPGAAQVLAWGSLARGGRKDWRVAGGGGVCLHLRGEKGEANRQLPGLV